VARISDKERARRRLQVELKEDLDDLTEIYEEARAIAANEDDHAEVTRLKTEFGTRRTAIKQRQEAEGFRGPGTTVQASTNTYFHWVLIAFDREAAAYKAMTDHRHGQTAALGRCLRESMGGITAASFSIESLFGSVCYLVPEPTKRPQRPAEILNALHQLFDLGGLVRLQQRMEELFDRRDLAVHPWVAVRALHEHPSLEGRFAKEVVDFTPEAASAGIDLACELLDACTTQPIPGHRRAARWANQNRSGVQPLLAAGARGPTV